MSVNTPTPYEGKSIATMLCRVVRSYFDDEKHREDFSKWYEERHGIPYKFKPQEVSHRGKRQKANPERI